MGLCFYRVVSVSQMILMIKPAREDKVQISGFGMLKLFVTRKRMPFRTKWGCC